MPIRYRTFVTRIADDDVVLAANGEEILGIGKITGPYQYKALILMMRPTAAR